MIPSSRRVGRSFFQVLLTKGRFYVSETFSVRFLSDGTTLPARFSVVVSKKLEKMAVGRNTLRRKMYSLLRPFLGSVRPGTLCVFFLKKKVDKSQRLSLALEIETFFKKSKLL